MSCHWAAICAGLEPLQPTTIFKGFTAFWSTTLCRCLSLAAGWSLPHSFTIKVKMFRGTVMRNGTMSGDNWALLIGTTDGHIRLLITLAHIRYTKLSWLEIPSWGLVIPLSSYQKKVNTLQCSLHLAVSDLEHYFFDLAPATKSSFMV